MNIREFIEARLDEDEAAARATLIDVDGSGDWRADERPVALTVNLYRVRDINARPVVEEVRSLDDDDDPDNIAEYVNGAAVSQHIARHDPARVLREVAARRHVLARHEPADREFIDGFACLGCGTSGDMDDPVIDDFNQCPELQDIAFIWHDHPDWTDAWCPHWETDEVEVTDAEYPRGYRGTDPRFKRVCRHCHNQDNTGWYLHHTHPDSA